MTVTAETAHVHMLSSGDIADLTGFYLCVGAGAHGRPAVKRMTEYCDSDRGSAVDGTAAVCPGGPHDRRGQTFRRGSGGDGRLLAFDVVVKRRGHLVDLIRRPCSPTTPRERDAGDQQPPDDHTPSFELSHYSAIPRYKYRDACTATPPPISHKTTHRSVHRLREETLTSLPGVHWLQWFRSMVISLFYLITMFRSNTKRMLYVDVLCVVTKTRFTVLESIRYVKTRRLQTVA